MQEEISVTVVRDQYEERMEVMVLDWGKVLDGRKVLDGGKVLDSLGEALDILGEV